MKKTVIGYQGAENSNAHKAATEFAKKLALGDDVEYRPLVSSEKVVAALEEETITYGVMAYKNNLGGYVKETHSALTVNCALCGKMALPIRHCVFVADSSVRKEDVTAVCSHIQALSQCRGNILSCFTNVELVEYKDTAKAASDLKLGKLPDEKEKTYAVICSEKAGTENGLYLLYDNFEDGDSITEFRIYEKSPYASRKEEEHPFAASPKSLFLSVLIHPVLWMMLAALFTLLAVVAYAYRSPLAACGAGLSLLTLVVLMRGKNWIRGNILLASITGYWKFYSAADFGSKEDVAQEHDQPRVAEITQNKGKIKLRGWFCGDPPKELFETEKTVIFCEKKAKNNYAWTLVYWYRSPSKMDALRQLSGIVVLPWETKTKFGRLYHIQNGEYWGMATKELGKLNYHRISEREFRCLKGE